MDFILQMNVDRADLSNLSLLLIFFSLRASNYQGKKKFKMDTAMSPLQKKPTDLYGFCGPPSSYFSLLFEPVSKRTL